MSCENVGDTYGEYTTLDDAKAACEADPRCGKVCDKFCDGRFLALCLRGSDETASNIGTCLYNHVRDGKNGYRIIRIF